MATDPTKKRSGWRDSHGRPELVPEDWFLGKGVGLPLSDTPVPRRADDWVDDRSEEERAEAEHAQKVRAQLAAELDRQGLRTRRGSPPPYPPSGRIEP